MNKLTNGLFALGLLAFAAIVRADEKTDAQQVQSVVEAFYDAWNQQDFVAAESLIGHSVIEFSMRDRSEPQTWVLQKLQTREDYLDGITGEWAGEDGRDYDPDIHKYIKEVEFFDIYIWDDLAMAIAQERLVGLSGPVSKWQSNAWLLNRSAKSWKIVGTLQQVRAEYETVQLETRTDHVRMRLFVDGTDEVFVDNEGVWIEHHDADLPGRHSDGNGYFPTHINGSTWQPVWQGDKTRKAYFKEKIALSPDLHYSLSKNRARDIAQVGVEPQKAGDPVSVLFADLENGADWYDVELRWSKEASASELPEPNPPGREDLLIEVLFDGEIVDSSPHQRPLENKAVSLAPDRAGTKEGAGYFDGKAFIGIDGFELDGPFSISIWAQYEEIEKRPYWWNNCIWAQDAGGNGVRTFQLSTLGRRVTWHRMQDEDLHSKLYLNKDRWYHFVAVYDGDFHRIFVDGVLQDHSQSTVETSPTQSIYIGAKNLDETDFFFTGKLDDARLYGRVLTVAEISALYQGLAE